MVDFMNRDTPRLLSSAKLPAHSETNPGLSEPVRAELMQGDFSPCEQGLEDLQQLTQDLLILLLAHAAPCRSWCLSRTASKICSAFVIRLMTSTFYLLQELPFL